MVLYMSDAENITNQQQKNQKMSYGIFLVLLLKV